MEDKVIPISHSLDASLLTSCDFPDVILFTQFGYTVCSGDDWRGSWSSINYSFFISTIWSMERVNKLGNVLCHWNIWKLCLGWRWAERRDAWFKTQLQYSSTKMTGKGASCWGWFPAKSCIQNLRRTPFAIAGFEDGSRGTRAKERGDF